MKGEVPHHGLVSKLYLAYRHSFYGRINQFIFVSYYYFFLIFNFLRAPPRLAMIYVNGLGVHGLLPKKAKKNDDLKQDI